MKTKAIFQNRKNALIDLVGKLESNDEYDRDTVKKIYETWKSITVVNDKSFNNFKCIIYGLIGSMHSGKAFFSSTANLRIQINDFSNASEATILIDMML